MASERRLTVVLAGDAKGLTRALDTAEGKVGGFGSKIGGLSGKTKVAMAGATTLVAGFAKSSVDAFVEAETAQSQLETAFAKFPQLAGANIDKLRDLNTELAKKTKFDDDATASGQAVLAQFGLTADQIAKATPLLQDYAARTGKDLPTAAQDFGKAMLGQGRAFKTVGVNFKDTGDKAGNFEQLMGGLNDKVGGFAAKQGKTAAGQAAILSNQFGELQESVGAKLVPALLKLAGFLNSSVLPAIQKLGAWLGEHKPVLIALAGVIGVGLTAAFVAWATAAASAAAATLAAAAPVIAIGVAIAALVAGVIWAYQNWGFFRDAVDAVASFITGTLWPALQSLASFFTDTLLPAISGAFGWIKDNWKLLLGILTGPIGLAVLAITTHWTTIKDGVTAVKDWIVDRFDDVVGFVTGLPDRIADAASGMWDGIKSAFKGVINWIIRAWNGLEFKIPGFDPPGPGPKFGGFTLGVPDIPELHSGGTYHAPPGQSEGLAMLRDGERVLTPEQQGAITIQVIERPGENSALTVVRELRRVRLLAAG